MATKVAMGINFALGAALTGISLYILEKSRKCTDSTFQRVAEGILIMSVALLVAAICYIICHVTCDCKESESAVARTMFAIYFISIGIILIVLGAVLHSKSKGQCEGARNGAVATWSLGTMVLLTSVGFFFFEIRGLSAKTAKKPESLRFW